MWRNMEGKEKSESESELYYEDDDSDDQEPSAKRQKEENVTQIIKEQNEKPRRPMSAYMMWLNTVREKVKVDNPGLKVTEIAKKGAEMWRNKEEKEKSVWQEKADQAKKKCLEDLEAYNSKCSAEGGVIEEIYSDDHESETSEQDFRDNDSDDQEPSAKKQKEENILQMIKEQIQSEIIKDIIVGSVKPEMWQKKCEIIPGVFIDLLNPDISELPLTTSPFGFKKESVVDLEVRNCKEVSISQCDRQLRILAQRIVRGAKYCEPYKLVVYEEGGHFEQHTDTAEKDLSETLVLHLPTECEGGDLMFNSWNPSKHYQKNRINYVLFSISHPHRVTHVSKGKRISLLFKVFNFDGKGCKRVIDGEYCYSVINIPTDYKNVLFTYPNRKVMTELFTNSNLDFKVVYYEHDDMEPEEVYSEVDFEDLSDDMSEDNFSHFTRYATRYEVNHIVDVGTPVEKSQEYSYYKGYTGNEPESASGKLDYFVGFLVNPKPAESSQKRFCSTWKF